jgi:hypothetical protein
MGSRFVERHKKKSLLALLLLLFRGRAKYALLLLLFVGVGTPFVVSNEMLDSFLLLSPVARMLRAVGLGSVISSLDPRYSSEFLRTAMDKAAAEREQSAYWNRMMGGAGIASPGSPSGGGSIYSLAMLRGGADIFNLGSGPSGKAAKPGGKRSDQVNGVLSEEEKARGENGDTVDLEGILGNAAGGAYGNGGNGGLYGDLMGGNLADKYASGGGFGGGSGSGVSGSANFANGPYVNRGAFAKGGGSVSGPAQGIYGNAVNSTVGKIPVPSAPGTRSFRGSKFGMVSGFTWKKIGYKTKSVVMDVRLSGKQPMYQLAETYGMTESAAQSPDLAPEYKAAYVGSTYDGNAVNLDIIQTDANDPVVPDVSFTGSAITDTGDIEKLAENCAKSEAVQGVRMSDDGEKIDRIASGMGSPPLCYTNIGPWNAKVREMQELCRDFNENCVILSQQCQSSTQLMDCGAYEGMIISRCRRPSGRHFAMLLAIVMAIFAAVLAVAGLLVAVIAAIIAYIVLSGGGGGGGGMGGGGESLYEDKDASEQDRKPSFEK